MAGRPGSNKKPLQHLWDFWTSRTVAVVLFLLLLFLLLLGLVVPQEPGDLDAADLARWWSAARDRYGERLDFYEGLGLLHLYRTPTFLVLVGALSLNTLLCTLDRLGRVWRSVIRPPTVRLPDAAYERADWQIAGVAPGQVRRSLRRRRYRVLEEFHHFYADRFRWTPLGTVLTHLGLLCFLAALLLHAGASWREQLVLDPDLKPRVVEGVYVYEQVRHRPEWLVGHGGLQTTISGDRLQNVQVYLEIQRGGEYFISGTTAPSAPFSVQGVNFYLRSSGLTLYAEAFDESGRELDVVMPGQDPFLRFSEGVSEASFDVPERDLHVTVTPSAWALVGAAGEPIHLQVDQAGQSGPLFEGEITGETIVEIPNGQIALYPNASVTVDAVHDPGFSWFLLGGLSLVVGGVFSLLFRPRRIWARLTEGGVLQIRFAQSDERGRQEFIAALARDLGRGGGS